jgi:AAA domain
VNPDINDTLRDEGPDAARIRHDKAQKYQPKGNGGADALRSPLPLTFFDQLTDHPAPKPWLIKNVIARGETSSWIAPPGRGKSALLTDIAIHLGSGTNWRNYRTKVTAGTVYFALERADLVRRRLVAYKRRDDLPDHLPIAVAGKVIDLMHKSCVQIICDTIKDAEQHFGREVGLAVIDTYPKGIAAGGGDESQAKDQNVGLANLRRVLDQANVHIAGIGHTGKDETKGERGSNARLADVDVLVQIAGDTIKTATVKKANDQPEGPLTSFRLEPFNFGTDTDGDPFRTYILAEEILAAIQTNRPLSDQQRLALEALAEVTLSHGHDVPAVDGLPHSLKAVTAEQWKAELYRRKILDQEAQNPRARFNELRTRLAAKKLIGVRDELVWAAHTDKLANTDGPYFENEIKHRASAKNMRPL